jgi:serine/threonine protein kinase
MNNLQSPLGAELAYSSSNFIILQVINRSNYSVQLVTSKLTKKKYAVKIFPFKNG